MREIQPQQQSVQPAYEPYQGSPWLRALGTFLPMAFGLPPIPAAGNLLGGYGIDMQSALSSVIPFVAGPNPFMGMPNYFQESNPFMNRMQGIGSPFGLAPS